MQCTYIFINKRSYRTAISNHANKQYVGAKHYPTAIKEWPSSVYTFNKSHSANPYNNDMLTDKIIKSYFNIDKASLSTKSKRMRDLIKRSSTRQIFVSKSLIKQTNDKVIITLFTFDRQKKKYNKKLFFLKNDLNSLLNNDVTKRKIKGKHYNKIVSKYNPSFNSYSKLLTDAFLNKKLYLKTLFFFYFLKWSISAFSLRICFLKKGDKILFKNWVQEIENNMFVLYSHNDSRTYITKKGLSKLLYLGSKEYYKVIIAKDKHTISSLVAINDILYKYLHILMSKYSDEDRLNIKSKLYILFKLFKAKYYKAFVKRYLRKEYLTLNYLYKLYINRVKSNELLLGLKYMLSQIYSKKVELNIINLKYLYMNGEIYTSAIAIKLRKKTSKLLRVLRKSLKLVKIPEKIRLDSINHSKNNHLNKSYIGLQVKDIYDLVEKSYVNSNNSIIDRLSSILNDMFYKSENESNIGNNILSSLKYKWITGARLEAKGRLTKRFTASRSLYKFKYKGNLKNMDYLNKSISGLTTGINDTSSLHMIRNDLKPNIQYTVTNSKKRIGTFGIKGWISNN